MTFKLLRNSTYHGCEIKNDNLGLDIRALVVRGFVLGVIYIRGLVYGILRCKKMLLIQYQFIVLSDIVKTKLLTALNSGLTTFVPSISTKLAKPSFNQMSFHHFIVTRFPNH